MKYGRTSQFLPSYQTTRCQSNGSINILHHANIKSLRLIDCVRERGAESVRGPVGQDVT